MRCKCNSATWLWVIQEVSHSGWQWVDSDCYLWSTSSRILFAPFVPWVRFKYSSTQVTRWSLKVPLIIWWRISGKTSSWISVHGKSLVNGCGNKCISCSNNNENPEHTTIWPTTPYSFHSLPSSHAQTISSVCSKQHCMASLPSRLALFAIHLKGRLLVRPNGHINTCTMDTIPAWCMPPMPAQGNLQYMVQCQRWPF